jgi:hypothetical protein
MGWLKVACAVAAGAVAVKALQTVMETDDPGVFVSGVLVTGMSGATAYGLAKSQIKENMERERLEYTERNRICGG